MAQPTNKRKPNLTKYARVQLRLSSTQGRRIEHAASLRGMSISDYIVSSADAAQTIEQHEVWTLTDQDREVFLRALMHPPRPSRRMRVALRRYRRLVRFS